MPALSTKTLKEGGNGHRVVTVAVSHEATAPPPAEPERAVRFKEGPTIHTYERDIAEDPAVEERRDLRVEARDALEKARSTGHTPPSTDLADTTEQALADARQALKSSDDIEAKWKAFQQAFDSMNKLLIANISQSLNLEAEECKKEHVEIDLQRATEMIRESSKIFILTGAGISVSSGLPTYRGNDGVWTKSSKNYTPEEIATLRVFEEDTEWSWEYYRGVFARCQAAEPNAGHAAIADLQKIFEDQGKIFQLVTTNIDDLHRRAGSTNFIEIHGNITMTRCTNESCQGKLIRPMPTKEKGARSHIPRCDCCSEMEGVGMKPPLRPHILWFDEGYTEELHSIKTVFKAVEEADLVITIGGTCTTGGPRRILQKAHDFDVPVIDINPKANTDISEVNLLQLLRTADDALPKIVKSLQQPVVPNKQEPSRRKVKRHVARSTRKSNRT